MESRLSLKKKLLKNIFKKDELSNKCKICNMEFDSPDRTKRHMIKAHSKPKREKQEY